LCKSHKDF
jgi:dynein heavy chain 1, cytosolic